jgi:type 1 glutamine amidotransferase
LNKTIIEKERISMKKKALIIYGGWEGHQPEETSALLAGELQSKGFEVERTNHLDALLDAARLKTLDLLVPHCTMERLTGDQERNLVAAVESGVGLGGIHGGMGDAFRNNTAYQFMVGGQFVAHPDNHKDYTVNLRAQTADPIIAGLDDFQVHSEQYYMHVDPGNQVLATTTFHSTSAPWVNGTIMPVVWKRHHGKGRVFYQSVGHGTKEFEIKEVLEITLRGLLWAAR